MGSATDVKRFCNKGARRHPNGQQVMALVVTGMLNKQGGGDLEISEITVKANRGRMMQKIKAEFLADLVNMAAKLGLGRGRPIGLRCQSRSFARFYKSRLLSK